MRKVENRIDSHMTTYPSITSSNVSVTEAAEFMKEMKFRHLPVLESGKVVGVLSERDLKQAELLSDSMQLIVSDVMTPHPYCVDIGTPLSTVAKEMANHKYGCVVVLNHQKDVVGIFTTTDGMRVLSEILSSDHGAEARTWKIERFLTSNTLLGLGA